MHILIAPNAFKNSLDANAAAIAIKEGFLKSRLECTCECFPVGDGGDGTANLIVRHLHGRMVETAVHDPLGRNISASFGLVDNDTTAVIEMADAAGLRLLKKEDLDPLNTSSFGSGEMIKAALDKNVQKIIIGMGGSATVDGGCGILQALGVRFRDAGGGVLENLPAGLINLAGIDIQGIDQRVHTCELVVLCDVNNTLLGEQGAAAVFAPQKGASPEAVSMLEKCLSRLAEITFACTGKNMTGIIHGGTAGGAAAGLWAFLNARLVTGIDYFLDITGFRHALERADLLVTGEGSIDEQTLNGKAPFGVALGAKARGIPVIALAGVVPEKPSGSLLQVFGKLVSINKNMVDMDTALQSAAANLTSTAAEIGNSLAL